MSKRIFDLSVSILGIILLSPIFFVLSLLIKRKDHGPVFYRGEPVGLHGRIFRIFKFRTMVVNAEKVGGPSTADDDPLITRIGGKLRKYKLDELPQLFDVLLGDMSLMGPRPEVNRHSDTFTNPQKAVLDVRPGIID